MPPRKAPTSTATFADDSPTKGYLAANLSPNEAVTLCRRKETTSRMSKLQRGSGDPPSRGRVGLFVDGILVAVAEVGAEVVAEADAAFAQLVEPLGIALKVE